MRLAWAFLGLLSLYLTSGRSWSRFFKLVFLLMRNACLWNPPTLAVSTATVGASVGLSWAILGHLAATGSDLGPSWADLGPILGVPGAILAEFPQNLLRQILRNAKFAGAIFA